MRFQSVREGLLPTVDSTLRKFGLYAAYRLDSNEYITTTETPLSLDEIGYEPNYLSALKYHPETRDSDNGSYRKVPDSHPYIDARITEDWDPVQCQYHVHVFETDEPDVVEVYSHYEVRPDIFSPQIDIGRLREHYRPERGETYLEGVVDPELEAIL